MNTKVLTYYILMAWTILGFFTNLDYTLAWGCIKPFESIFSKANIFFTTLAIGLISAAVFVPFKTLGRILLSFELILFLYKLTMIKGGYVVGFGGAPALSVLAFDSVAITLRLLLLKQIFKVNIKTLYIPMLTILILIIKIQFFR